MRVSNDILEVGTLLSTFIRQSMLAKVFVLMMDRLLLNLVEMVRLKLKRSYLLSFRQAMAVVGEVIIIVMRVRCKVQILCRQRIFNHLLLVISVAEHVVLTRVLLPILGILSKLLVLSLV